MGPSATGYENNAAGGYKSARQSLRPLQQAPSASPPSAKKTHLTHSRIKSYDEPPKYNYTGPAYSPTSLATQPSGANAIGLGRADCVSRRSQQHSATNPHAPVLSTPELQTLRNSTTSHLRTLSRFAGNESSEDFSIDSPTPSVAGMRGRRQLKRTDSTRGSKTTGNGRSYAWGERNWMDKQRQFLQAYEYLCHIGEAKEWIEDIIDKPLPPIVQLEEALRDGVTLAEIVQALHPNQPMRIFRNPKLQYRHSDNIALFFRFLGEVELPELFRFELIDLYEKKNIPKVIYCIHALSWLLYRKGIVDFRIGNLVGQLEFEHHELEEMQKGLDKSGVSMPSFSGMGASFGAEPEPESQPEPEPVESEEERIARELREKESSVCELQAQLRGAMVRIGLGYTMQSLWDSEGRLVELQSIIRAAWARQIAEYRLSMQIFATNLQSAARGAIIRRRQQGREQWWKGRESEVILLQSLARARKSRVQTQNLRVQVRKNESGIRKFQAAIRGAMERQRFDEQYTQAVESESQVIHLQSAIRGLLQRQRANEQISQTKRCAENAVRLQAAIRGFARRRTVAEDKSQLLGAHQSIVALQNSARAMAVRSSISRQQETLNSLSGLWRALQSVSRGAISRQRFLETKRQLRSHEQSIISLQALVRAKAIRSDVKEIKHQLASSALGITKTQSASRACLVRTKILAELQALEAEASRIATLQASVRGWSTRQRQQRLQQELHENVPEIVLLQGLARAMMIRSEVGALLNELEDVEPVIAELQAAIRGGIVRGKYAEKKAFFKANMEKVVKVQSFVRGKLQGEAYKSLTNGSNPPVGTVKGFVHLLNDSDFDFDEEVEFERLRKTVIQHVRQNELADQYITQLDIKIALLVKNRITLDEVVKHQKHFGGDAGSLLTNTEISSKDPFDLKALNKNSRRKLEHYQEMFFILQTQPQYLARYFKRIREQATAEKECERIKHLMMGLFGYAQKRREEYYLIKLITRSIREEIDHCPSIKDYLRGHYFWAKLFGAYVKSPRDRKYMRDLLGPVIKENVIDNPELNLESDPMQIYLSAIENEQLRTGRRSNRSPDIPREEAIRDEETKRTFIAHLQDLRDIADQFFTLLEEQLHKMPYGVRYIAQQMFNYLVAHFPHEEQSYVLQIVGHWVWKAYLQPALLEPEKHGAIDRGLSQEHRRNIGQVVKVLSQVAAGRLFGGENVFLQPLNSYVRESIERLGDIWGNCEWLSVNTRCILLTLYPVINVSNAEEQFDIDEFNDLYARTKPTLYIKMADIFSIHHLVAAEHACICPGHDDLLREVIRELGSAKNNENELMSVSSSEICLTLNPKLHEAEGMSNRHSFAIIEVTDHPRPRCRSQSPFHRNQTLHPLHHPSPVRLEPNGNNGQAHNNGRRRPLGRPCPRRALRWQSQTRRLLRSHVPHGHSLDVLRRTQTHRPRKHTPPRATRPPLTPQLLPRPPQRHRHRHPHQAPPPSPAPRCRRAW